MAALTRDITSEHDDPERAARAREFVGARFEDCRLDRRVLDAADEQPIDLRESTVSGTLTLAGSTVRHELRFDGAAVGAIDARRCRFERPVSFVAADVRDEADFHRATFSEEVGLRNLTVGGETSFTDCRFDGPVVVQEASFNDATSFDRARFAEGLAGLRSTFRGRLHLPGVVSHGEVRLVDSTLASGGNFTGITVHDGVLLRGASLGDADEIASKTGLSPVDFSEAEVDRLQVDPANGDSLTVGLRRATVRNGRLAASTSAKPEYDLEGSTLGDVTLDGPFGAYRTVETAFDGFDFTTASNRAPITDGRSRVAPHTNGEIDSATAESTYLKLKNGAAAVGADRVASEFFRRERIARRGVYRDRMGNASVTERVRLAGAWLANVALGVSTGHGERPSRVIATSVSTVGVFSLVYWQLWVGAPPYGHPGGYLLLSLESFVTLVLGGAADVSEPWWLRLIAKIEGFLGVFLVALFVFTLTRSIHR